MYILDIFGLSYVVELLNYIWLLFVVSRDVLVVVVGDAIARFGIGGVALA